jgi:hypothetical protein
MLEFIAEVVLGSAMEWIGESACGSLYARPPSRLKYGTSTRGFEWSLTSADICKTSTRTKLTKEVA